MNSIKIKDIRKSLNLTQKEFAEKVGVSFATVNRWEQSHFSPSKIAIHAIKRLCKENDIKFSQYEENRRIVRDDKIILYHGSKSGLHGPIQPISRDRCDFGKGFYMGSDYTQPLTLICNYPEAILYTMKVDLSGLTILDIEVGLEWALLIAYHRGKMDFMKDSYIYKKFSMMEIDCDIIIGYIANDRMFVVLDRFFNGEITDLALINSLSALKLGKQYVALTKKACSQIEIIEKKHISYADREKLKIESKRNRIQGISLAEEISKKFRREGKFFDEIMKLGENYDES